MARLTAQKFTLESIKDAPEWLGKVFNNLNQFLTEVNESYNNRLTLGENLYQELRDVSFVNNSGNFPLSFITKWPVFPKAVMIAYCYNNTDEVMESITSLPVWEYNNGSLSVNSIAGLTSGKSYTIRVLVLYG